MLLRDATSALARLAPESLAEPWDRVGLHVGDNDQNVQAALLCIDLTEAVAREAVEAGAQLIVAYHPPIFEPVVRLTVDDWKARTLMACVKAGLAVYSPHTALDAAAGGVNDFLADLLGPSRRYPIRPLDPAGSGRCKVVTFVPAEHADRLREAMAKAGAGRIGDYTQCSFQLTGEGTFLGGAGTTPAVGQAGRLERVAEVRLEMICPRPLLAEVVAALRRVHPYEEPALDLIPLLEEPRQADRRVGQGRLCYLDEPLSVEELVARVKAGLGLTHLEVALPEKIGGQGFAPGRVGTVALCAGAGGAVLKAAAAHADAYLTGEMRHHDVLDAVQSGKVVLLAGHTATERPYLPALAQRLQADCPGVTWTVSRQDGQIAMLK